MTINSNDSMNSSSSDNNNTPIQLDSINEKINDTLFSLTQNMHQKNVLLSKQLRSNTNVAKNESTHLARSLASTTLVEDRCVTVVPKFKINEGMKDEYMANLPKLLELVKANEQDTCLHYGFVGPTKDDNDDNFVICREGYKNAEGLLFHLENVKEPLQEALRCAEIVSFDVQGPSSELEKLKVPLATFGLDMTYYELQPGSMRSETL